MGMSRSARGADLLPGADLLGGRSLGDEKRIRQGEKAKRGLDQLRLK